MDGSVPEFFPAFQKIQFNKKCDFFDFHTWKVVPNEIQRSRESPPSGKDIIDEGIEMGVFYIRELKWILVKHHGYASRRDIVACNTISIIEHAHVFCKRLLKT